MFRLITASLSARESGELSTVFDAGGALGAILAGLVADHTGAPAAVCLGFYIAGAPAVCVLLIYIVIF